MEDFYASVHGQVHAVIPAEFHSVLPLKHKASHYCFACFIISSSFSLHCLPEDV